MRKKIKHKKLTTTTTTTQETHILKLKITNIIKQVHKHKKENKIQPQYIMSTTTTATTTTTTTNTCSQIRNKKSNPTNSQAKGR